MCPPLANDRRWALRASLHSPGSFLVSVSLLGLWWQALRLIGGSHCVTVKPKAVRLRARVKNVFRDAPGHRAERSARLVRGSLLSVGTQRTSL